AMTILQNFYDYEKLGDLIHALLNKTGLVREKDQMHLIEELVNNELFWDENRPASINAQKLFYEVRTVYHAQNFEHAKAFEYVEKELFLVEKSLDDQQENIDSF